MTHDQIVYLLLHTPTQHAFLGALLALAPLIGKLFGGTEKARTDARIQETQLNNQQDTNAINRAVVDNNLTQSKQDSAVKNALRAGIKDYSVTRPDGVPMGHSVGGLRPSAITGVNGLGTQFENSDLASIMAGTPKLTPPPQANGFDKLLNIGGGIAGLLGLAGQVKNTMNPDGSDPNDPNSRVRTKLPSPFTLQ